jgi:hypothetical protein
MRRACARAPRQAVRNEEAGNSMRQRAILRVQSGDIVQQVQDAMWQAAYRRIEAS